MSDDFLLKCLRHRVPNPRRGYKSDDTVLLNPHGEPAADRIEELEAKLAECEARLEKVMEALRLLIDHTHNCEKEMTEELHSVDFCGESLLLSTVRIIYAELKG